MTCYRALLGEFLKDFFIKKFFSNFWLLCTDYGILVLWPGFKPMPAAMEVQSPNHWTTREMGELFNLLCTLSMKFSRSQRMPPHGSRGGGLRLIVLTYFYCGEILSISAWYQNPSSLYSDICFRDSLQTFKYHLVLCNHTACPQRTHSDLLIL